MWSGRSPIFRGRRASLEQTCHFFMSTIYVSSHGSLNVLDEQACAILVDLAIVIIVALNPIFPWRPDARLFAAIYLQLD